MRTSSGRDWLHSPTDSRTWYVPGTTSGPAAPAAPPYRRSQTKRLCHSRFVSGAPAPPPRRPVIVGASAAGAGAPAAP